MPTAPTNPAWNAHEGSRGLSYSSEASELDHARTGRWTDPWGRPVDMQRLQKTHDREGEILTWEFRVLAPDNAQVLCVVFND